MKHFTIAELSASTTAKTRGIDNSPTSGVVIALTALIENVLDPAREVYGKPIKVHSGYRCPQLNKIVGGVPTSQHQRGEAADIDTGTKDGNKQLYEIIKKRCAFDQLINEKDFAWVHVSYRRQPAVNRRQAFALPIIALLMLLMSCAKVQYVPYTRVERVIDTITRTIPDSAALRALFACDSLGQVYVRELSEYKGKEAQQDVSFKDGELKVETKWRTQYIDRIREVHDTTTVVQEVEIPCDGRSCAAAVELKHKGVPAFFWWCFAISILALIYIIYKIIRKFKG